jgi:hypothetical protein
MVSPLRGSELPKIFVDFPELRWYTCKWRITMKYEKALELLSPEQRQDCEGREMLGSVKSIKAYLWETIEVVKASKRMTDIDIGIARLTPEQQQKRRNRIEAQRRAWNKAIHAIENTQVV